MRKRKTDRTTHRQSKLIEVCIEGLIFFYSTHHMSVLNQAILPR